MVCKQERQQEVHSPGCSIIHLFSFKIYLFVCGVSGESEDTCMLRHTREGQGTAYGRLGSQFSYSAMWILGMGSRFSGLMAAEPSHCPHLTHPWQVIVRNVMFCV